MSVDKSLITNLIEGEEAKVKKLAAKFEDLVKKYKVKCLLYQHRFKLLLNIVKQYNATCVLLLITSIPTQRVIE